MRFRIGVHLGDVFEKSDGTIYGDGVNVAARIESLADAGGIALSDAVERAVRGKIEQPIRNRGVRRVKNIQEPISLYAVELAWQPQGSRRTESFVHLARRPMLMGTGGLIIALALVFLWFGRRGHIPPAETHVQLAAMVGPSIAVLPFADLSEGRDQSYFSDGLSEEVIDRLAQIPELRVIARTSAFGFKDSSAKTADIARQLNVSTLLEGSVRRSADRIRVSAQLIRASDSAYIWSGTYEKKLTDVFAVQDAIANAVVAALKVSFKHAGSRLDTNRYAPRPEAYDQYLLGRQLMRIRSAHYVERAIEAFSKAVAIDVNYGAAYAALGFAESFLAEDEHDPQARRLLMDKALAAAERAVAVGPLEPDAYATRGFLRFEARWDAAGADADLSKALAMDPTAEPTLAKYSYFLMAMGRGDEALALTKRLKETDPFFAPPWETEARIAAARGDYTTAEDALRHAHSILQVEPEAGELMPTIALLKKEPERARKLFAQLPDPVRSNWGLALAEQDLNHPAAATSKMQAYVAQAPYEHYSLGVIHARAHRNDEAFAALQKAYEAHDGGMELILIDPLLANLREDERYGNLLRQIGFTAPIPGR